MESPERIAELKTIEDYQRLLYLIARDHVFMYVGSNPEELQSSKYKDRHLGFAVNCNDTFYYACSDFTEFDLRDTSELVEMFDEFGTVGLIAWCARERNEQPLAQLMTDEYHKAYAYAGKFYAPKYNYVLLCSNQQKPALDEFLSDISHTSEVIDEEHQHHGYKACLTEEQFQNAYAVAHCIYRIHSKDRVKQCKFQYFNGYSIENTNKIVGRMIGSTYHVMKGFIPIEGEPVTD